MPLYIPVLLNTFEKSSMQQPNLYMSKSMITITQNYITFFFAFGHDRSQKFPRFYCCSSINFEFWLVLTEYQIGKCIKITISSQVSLRIVKSWTKSSKT